MTEMHEIKTIDPSINIMNTRLLNGIDVKTDGAINE
jgi:hypothetical protein